jgi:hypothetical protein
MKKLVIISSIVLIVACKKGSDVPATETNLQSTNQANGNGPVTRPFTASLQSSIDPDPSIPPTPCSGDLPGWANPGHFMHGTASHLGELKWEESRLQDVSCNINLATAQLTTSIAGQFTAANGDRVFYTGNDVIDITNLLTQGGTTGSFNGTWTITGGTGRFAGATGSFTVNGLADFTTFTFNINAVGSISY